jgi:hypothetical protein
MPRKHHEAAERGQKESCDDAAYDRYFCIIRSEVMIGFNTDVGIARNIAQGNKRRSRKNNSAKNLAGLLRLAYDIIKSGGVPKRMPIKRLRKQALVDDNYLERLVSSVF